MIRLRKIKKRIQKSSYSKHETKKNILKRFFLILLVFIAYFVFTSFRYGIGKGFYVSILTWSFFVFCTPIADAGFLIDFPIRLITKIRMVYSEIFVWITAALLNVFTIIFNPSIYNKTLILVLFKQILTNPFPFWLIILVSAVGTFLSIYFADELVDVAKHEQRKKYKKHKSKFILILIIFIIILIIILYDFLLRKLKIPIKLF